MLVEKGAGGGIEGEANVRVADTPTLSAPEREGASAQSPDEHGDEDATAAADEQLQDKRLRRRNRIGRYAMEIEIELLSGASAGQTQWLSMEGYEELWNDAEDVGDDVMLGRASDIAPTATSRAVLLL
ncbi:hypothetical protein ATCC90586_008851 [Pythium insidiosum]|nr:hypothetical protein ATCC90586_008851 [Pythium insidiosum]